MGYQENPYAWRDVYLVDFYGNGHYRSLYRRAKSRSSSGVFTQVIRRTWGSDDEPVLLLPPGGTLPGQYSSGHPNGFKPLASGTGFRLLYRSNSGVVMMVDDIRTLPATRMDPADPAGDDLGRKTTTLP